MAEALSQSQIDELLQRMRSGDVEEAPKEEVQKIKEYDFFSPKKFTKDQLKSLNTLYENFARVLAIYFTRVSRSVCEVEVSSIEEQQYHEFNNALPDNTLIGMISFEPEEIDYDGSTLIMELPTSFGFLIIDRLMGGSGSVYAPDREYTEIEMALLDLVLTNIAQYMQEAWSNFFPLKIMLHSVETDGRLLQAYSQQDVVVIASLEVRDGDYSGMMNICMPAENLEEVIDGFSVKYSRSEKHHDAHKEQQKKNIILEYLKESDLEVEAILDSCQMELSDVGMLQPGDIIALNKKINSNINVTIEGIPWCTARMGEVDQMKALKLVDILAK